jgi:hypothetical protein
MRPSADLGPLGRPIPSTDAMLAAVRRANVGAALEIERYRRRDPRPVDRIEELEREIEALRAELYEMWAGLPF